MQPSIPWSSSVSLFVIEMMAIIHSLKCTLPFSFAVPLLSLAVTHCHSLSLVIILCHSLYHSLSFAVTRCHSLLLVVTRCTTRLSVYKRSMNNVSIPSSRRDNKKAFFIIMEELSLKLIKKKIGTWESNFNILLV